MNGTTEGGGWDDAPAAGAASGASASPQGPLQLPPLSPPPDVSGGSMLSHLHELPGEYYKLPREQTTSIHGIGLWNSWTRNFATPMLAMWDLLDNAIDAGCPTYGRVHIDPDRFSRAPLSGIRIMNTCRERVAHLSEILKAYKSSKAKEVEAGIIGIAADSNTPFNNDDGANNGQQLIGENGVGIKQGCATLSDLSFVLTRNEGDLALGILAKELQKVNGIYLPSWTWNSPAVRRSKDQYRIDGFTNPDDIQDLLEKEIIDKTTCGVDIPLQQIFALYGGWKTNLSLRDHPFSAPPTDMYRRGIQRLAQHFLHMVQPDSHGEWGRREHVFCLVLHNLKHSGGSSNRNGEPRVKAEFGEQPADPASNQDPVTNFLYQMKNELPRQYLHILHTYDVQVDKKPVFFSYWQRRLVELTQLDVIIDAQHPATAQNLIPNADINGYTPLRSEYKLRVYLGFDPVRVKDSQARIGANDAKATPMLVYYSRKAGRLIKVNKDCRSELSLTTGTTLYCQGLTIIVDDIEGHLPLDPTKQKFAFGEQSRGEDHENNLKLWVSAAAAAYWQHHFRHSNDEKKVLSKKIESLHSEALRHIHDNNKEAPLNIKSIGECEFKLPDDLKWRKYPKKIGPELWNFSFKKGKDTIMEFLPPPAAPLSGPPPAAAEPPPPHLAPPVQQFSPAAAVPRRGAYDRKRKRSSRPQHSPMTNEAAAAGPNKVISLAHQGAQICSSTQDSEGMHNNHDGDDCKMPAAMAFPSPRNDDEVKRLQDDLQRLKNQLKDKEALANKYKVELMETKKELQGAKMFSNMARRLKAENEENTKRYEAKHDQLVQKFKAERAVFIAEAKCYKAENEELRKEMNELKTKRDDLKNKVCTKVGVALGNMNAFLEGDSNIDYPVNV